jgi:hypothetical protein
MHQKYKQHFEKIMRTLEEQYLAMIPAGSVSAKTRLEIFLKSYFNKQPPTLKAPEGSILAP